MAAGGVEVQIILSQLLALLVIDSLKVVECADALELGTDSLSEDISGLRTHYSFSWCPLDGDTVAVLMLVVSVANGAFRSLSAGVSSAVSSGDAMLGTDFGAAVGDRQCRFPCRSNPLGELQKQIRIGRYVMIRPGQILHVLDGARFLRALIRHDEIAKHEAPGFVRFLRKATDGKAGRRYQRIVIGRWPILMAFGATAFLHRCQHHQQVAAFLLHHSPEVIYRRR
uniref:Uncharacterized protein n=1 Tax=Anopheles culicifacies TaxID=139723 RepID=A0A182MQG8_9DIPT